MKQEFTEHWTTLLENKNVNQCWDIIHDKLMSLIQKHISAVKISSKKRKPLWMNQNALTKVKKNQQAFQRYLSTKEGKDYLEYVKYRNQAKTACRYSTKIFERQLSKEGKYNPKAFFSYVKSKISCYGKIPDLIIDETRLSTDIEKATCFNDYFNSVYTKEDTDSIPYFPPKIYNQVLDNIIFTPEIVKKKLKQL